MDEKTSDKRVKDNEYQNTLDVLIKHAPEMPLREAVYFARHIGSVAQSEYYAKCTLAILSTILLEKNAAIPNSLLDKYKDNKAMMSCFEQMQNCNAWVCCGPVANAMDDLMKERTTAP